ncbi:hypothetical protein [Companilactobacillus sp.]|jgi:hypothetical protein|uniref:hypothetical protein n=1 Tax=Companilactobacillus sp. TaxID=2767905 RepID=UPI0025C06E2A|nr:hypothetical protein [Companilactobacillus sp.]MCH4010216.1 hypothetical protein [Companilactobacillus sp.]MCH4052108.1 hypothetical protein [Companilactobacillus sp.]MCH4078158.1 hypothetical protein [Companilactobacillus sp.]MCH4126734.1 hypothetical protein [Companilactobacillus sp.]MCH4132319.1 hypothetical protein [Companilactobacillus sp.]
MLTLLAANSNSGTALLIAVLVAVFVILWLLFKTVGFIFRHPIVGILLILFGILGLWNYAIIGIGALVGGIVFLIISYFFNQ